MEIIPSAPHWLIMKSTFFYLGITLSNSYMRSSLQNVKFVDFNNILIWLSSYLSVDLWLLSVLVHSILTVIEPQGTVTVI